MGRIKNWTINILCGVASNALSSWLAGGAAAAVITAILAWVRAISPVWQERAITALITLAIITVGSGLQSLIKRKVQSTYGQRSHELAGQIDGPEKPEFIEIVNQTLERRDIPLDGYRYLGCTFTDITFVYNNGETGGFDHTCRIGGKIGFKSEDPHIQGVLGLLASLRLLRPDLQENYTAKLGAPNPTSGTLVIKNPTELASYYSELGTNWNRCTEKFTDVKLIYEYLQNFWDELVKNQRDSKHAHFEKLFPGQSMSFEDIQPIQTQMSDKAIEFRNQLVDFLSLLGFSFSTENNGH